MAEQPTCRLLYLVDDQHIVDAVRRARGTGAPPRHPSEELAQVLQRLSVLEDLGFTADIAFADESALPAGAVDAPVLVIFDVLHSLRRARKLQARLAGRPGAAVPLIMLTNDEFIVNDGELKLTWPIRKSEGVSPLTMFATRLRDIPPRSMRA